MARLTNSLYRLRSLSNINCQDREITIATSVLTEDLFVLLQDYDKLESRFRNWYHEKEASDAYVHRASQVLAESANLLRHLRCNPDLSHVVKKSIDEILAQVYSLERDIT